MWNCGPPGPEGAAGHPLSALLYFTDGKPEVQRGAATYLGHTTARQGLGGKGWLQDSPLTYKKSPLSPYGATLLRTHLHQIWLQRTSAQRPELSFKETLHQWGPFQAYLFHSAGPLWMGLPSSLGQLSHYKATDRLPQGWGKHWIRSQLG